MTKRCLPQRSTFRFPSSLPSSDPHAAPAAAYEEEEITSWVEAQGPAPLRSFPSSSSFSRQGSLANSESTSHAKSRSPRSSKSFSGQGKEEGSKALGGFQNRAPSPLEGAKWWWKGRKKKRIPQRGTRRLSMRSSVTSETGSCFQ